MIFHCYVSSPEGKQTGCDIESGPVEIVDLPINSMVIFQFVFCMFTRPGHYGGNPPWQSTATVVLQQLGAL